ncbi:hypothetical protein EI42_03289 [Thermosporothrix hazakensis]|uniref:Uncharacterized protein n=1 Tax=Thermosporothrix hazakensis TaxID=644383 RepID=A0A326U6A0_THEHA|nr:hypothetical protein [Thermosporothrix hazakensis]PZW27911.1 hypothetical protein EI42_03289 [Thermosporothrix hazakensis]GCE51136.1 hypothetical protein KTH_60050 [Thermosporothrix hazakensis]
MKEQERYEYLRRQIRKECKRIRQLLRDGVTPEHARTIRRCNQRIAQCVLQLDQCIGRDRTDDILARIYIRLGLVNVNVRSLTPSVIAEIHE